MKLLDLFSGIGGFSLAASWAGIETVAFCEIDPFCQKVLRKYWPYVPIYSDIRDLRGSEIGTVDIVSGGFPCQPFSCAGKRRGKEDDRYLWPEMFRVIKEVKPRWVVAENVTGIIRLALDDVLSDLESEGYETGAFIIPACAVGAPHKRNRVWIVGYADSNGLQGTIHQRNCETKSKEFKKRSTIIGANSEDSWNGETFKSCLGGESDGLSFWLDLYKWPAPRGCEQYNWEPPRVAKNMPDRVPRLLAIGNAIVPQVAFLIFKAIVTIEEASLCQIPKQDKTIRKALKRR